MRFWDSSALVPLFVRQPSTAAMRALYREEARVCVWQFTDLEIRSALCRLERERAITTSDCQRAAAELAKGWEAWAIVVLVDVVQARAHRLVAVHPLRAADALQLAAALVLAQDRPIGAELVTLDRRLADAARREGFRVLPE